MEIKDTFWGSKEDNRYRAPADTGDAQLASITLSLNIGQAPVASKKREESPNQEEILREALKEV